MNHIIIIAPAIQYGTMPTEQQASFIEMIRHYLVDKSANPMACVSMVRGGDKVYVVTYWREHVTPEPTTETIAALNAQLSPIGVKVIECDDIQAALAAEGVRAIETEDYL